VVNGERQTTAPEEAGGPAGPGSEDLTDLGKVAGHRVTLAAVD